MMGKISILNLFRSKATVFTFKEVLLASGEKQPALLRRRLSYYVRTGALYAIRRGLYAKDKNYDRLELATKIFMPSYVSFETILLQAGVIFQYESKICVATYQSKEISCDGQIYCFRKIKDSILLDSAGVVNRGNYFAATKERAFLDVLYLNKDYHFDNLEQLDKRKVFELLSIYNNKRMVHKVSAYFKALDKDRI